MHMLSWSKRSFTSASIRAFISLAVLPVMFVSGLQTAHAQEAPLPSPLILRDDVTGGDCTQVGEWDAAIKTCTLSRDVDGSGIEIYGSGLSLNGGQHILRAPADGANPFEGQGVKIRSDYVSVYDLAVSGFAQGIVVVESAHVTVKNVTVSSCDGGITHAGAGNAGVYTQYAPYTTVVDSTFTGCGINISYNNSYWGSPNSTVQNNTVKGTSATAPAFLTIASSPLTTVRGNVVQYGAISLSDSASSTVLDNEAVGVAGYVVLSLSRSAGTVVGRNHIAPPTDIPERNWTSGVYLDSSPHVQLLENRIDDCTIVSATCYGVYAFSSDGTLFESNHIDGADIGMHLRNMLSGTVRNNIIQGRVYALEWDGASRGEVADINVWEGNIFRGASLGVRMRVLESTVTTGEFVLTNNNFIDNEADVYANDSPHVHVVAPPPKGGNYWDAFDTPEEGCIDGNSDGFCDAPYALNGPGTPYYSTYAEHQLIDEHPRVCPIGEQCTEPQPPVSPVTLSLPSESPYDSVRGVASTGPYPERGTADKDVFTFKVVYTNANNTPSQALSVHIGTSVDDQPSVLPLTLDAAATDAALRDGNYANGEQYSATSTFSKEKYFFSFRGTTTDGTAFALVDDSSSYDTNILTFQTGYSSVAFIPGIQASRLFREGVFFENQLWEPNRDADAQALRMRDTGESVNPDIYTKAGAGGVVDEVLGVGRNVYKSFVDDLSALAVDGTISGFAVLPYDWRLAFGDILSRGNEVDGKLYFDASHGTDTHYIPRALHELAQSSDSGKVTIVAHSMGGLLAKALLANLEDNEEHPYRSVLDEVDTVVLVASPQLGTPKAIGALVHGYDTELDVPYLGWPNVTKGVTARSLSQNMRSAYTLLPSAAYFTRVNDIDEDGTVLPYTTVVSDSIGTVRNHDALTQYLTRSPYYSSHDLVQPLHLWGPFIDEAQRLHSRIDTWTPPDTDQDGIPDIRIVQIAGWGKTDTLKGIRYAQARRQVTCPAGFTGACYETIQDPQPVFTVDGDGTVDIPSAVAMGTTTNGGVETWYVNLFDYNRVSQLHLNREHGDVFEIDEVRTLLAHVMRREDVSTYPFAYIYRDPTVLKADEDEPYLRLSLHSPVAIVLYDGEGNHTGHAASSTANSPIYDEQIPNSYYLEFGEGKYLGMPGTEAHTVKLDGLAKGTFTLKLQEQVGDVTMKEVVFEDIPVTASTTGTIMLTKLTTPTQPVLVLDIDGNGTTDFTLSTAGTGVSVLDRVKIAKAYANTLTAPRWLKDWILLRLDLIEKLLTATDKRSTPKGNVVAARALLKTLLWSVENQAGKLLAREDAESLKAQVEQLLRLLI